MIKYWADLTEEERRITSLEDTPIKSVIKGLSHEVKKEIHSVLCDIPSIAEKEYGKEYCLTQKEWLNFRGQMLWENELHCDKEVVIQNTDLFLKEVMEGEIPKEYRIYFAVKHPELFNKYAELEGALTKSKELSDVLQSVYDATGGKYGIATNTPRKVA
jgi:hypothetical protein